jgi:Cytochrome P460
MTAMKVAESMTFRWALRAASVLVLVGLIYAVVRTPFDNGLRAADEKAKTEKPAGKGNEPQYTATGELKVPTDFYTWVFVGSNLGIEYREPGAPEAAPAKETGDAEKPRNFHNVYINPEAYDVYAKTGKFPEKTMLILDMYKADAGEPKDIVSDGRFPGKQTGLAVAVKNSTRPDGSKTDWAYYEFALDKPTAKAFPDKACFDCHLEHADEDNVWVRFYPTLRRLHAGKKAKR